MTFMDMVMAIAEAHHENERHWAVDFRDDLVIFASWDYDRVILDVMPIGQFIADHSYVFWDYAEDYDENTLGWVQHFERRYGGRNEARRQGGSPPFTGV